MDIGEVSRRSGFSVATLRYYEELGLIRSTERKGLRRQYPPTILNHLSLISLGKEAGFSLQEVGVFFKSNNGQMSIDRNELKKKASTITREIDRLVAIRDGLQHAAECPASSHLECPTFTRLLRLAVKKQKRSKD
ncbi:helix-turn-helix domain-containing protein [Undibacterium cyanobacteriorum]|uniref:Helix-turn-helix domain-containing protein n=1 Tax=Undibacterium cyanobacteriorum TaxID=3073561 RepID=A0ABY9RJJ9_9BURK|nr:helix-turn-helix domain-containing protein [Undibacterium sp. 20NA77.5]WMW80246.1 helix-turn-helix domain-containing protein [Undibacterium sp. 20NA77.5]